MQVAAATAMHATTAFGGRERGEGRGEDTEGTG